MSKVLLALLVAMSLTPGFAANPDQAPQPKVKVGDMAPDFTLEDQDGNASFASRSSSP